MTSTYGFGVDLSTGGPSWLTSSRAAAFQRFSALGFPGRRNEEWRYTNISALQGLEVGDGSTSSALVGEQLVPHLYAGSDTHRLVFVNGFYSAELSAGEAPDGVRVGHLSALIDEAPEALRSKLAIGSADSDDDGWSISGAEHPFAYLNAAHLADGAYIHVPRGKVVERPVELLFVTTESSTGAVASHPRIVIIAEELSELTVVETFVGLAESPYVTNAVAQIEVGAGATVRLYKVQRESEQAFHLSNTRAFVERDGNFENIAISCGGGVVRNDINTVLTGEGSQCTVDGLYITRGKQHIDNHSSIDHTVPNCNSFQVYKGVLADKSTAVFNGKIFVRPDAQKTDAKQSNKNLLLSGDATINTKPQLEIWADDVRCTHGATVGQLDGEAMFYLQTRGLSKSAARALLTHAFANEVIGNIAYEPLRERLSASLNGWLP